MLRGIQMSPTIFIALKSRVLAAGKRYSLRLWQYADVLPV